MYQAVKMVLDFAPDHWTVGCRLVAIACGERANINTREFYPGVKDIAQRTSLSERQVQRYLRQLEAEKVITRLGNRRMVGGGLGTNVWRWNWLVSIGGGDMGVTRGGDMGVTTFPHNRGDMGVTQTRTS